MIKIRLDLDDIGLLLDVIKAQEERQNDQRHQEKEDVAPAQVVDDKAPEGRPQGRSNASDQVAKAHHKTNFVSWYLL